jgi:hypothetical protein
MSHERAQDNGVSTARQSIWTIYSWLFNGNIIIIYDYYRYYLFKQWYITGDTTSAARVPLSKV